MTVSCPEIALHSFFGKPSFFMPKMSRPVIRYSVSFKQSVVQEIEAGAGIEATRRRYGIKGCGTIPNWLRQLGHNHLINKIVRVETLEERDRVKSLELQLMAAKVALADALLAQRCLESVIEAANETYKVDLKKSFGLG